MGFSEFSGLRNSASLPFSRKSSEDFLSVIAFQTSAVSVTQFLNSSISVALNDRLTNGC